METPPWLTLLFTWLTSLTVAWNLLLNVIREQRRSQRRRRQRPETAWLSLAHLSYRARSVVEDLWRFCVLLWAATKPTAKFIGRVGVLVVLGVSLYFGLTLPASVPDWEWLSGIPVAIVVGGGGYAIARARAEDPPDDEPDNEPDLA